LVLNASWIEVGSMAGFSVERFQTSRPNNLWSVLRDWNFNAWVGVGLYLLFPGKDLNENTLINCLKTKWREIMGTAKTKCWNKQATIANSTLPHKRAVIAQSVQRWATGWTIGVLGFDSRRGLGIFLLTTVSRTALGPTQPPIQRVPKALSLGVNRPSREADHSPPSSAEIKNA
jgi:hypothetical protein